MRLYTWKDVERYINLNRKRWEKDIVDIEVYSSEMIVSVQSLQQIEDVRGLLSELFEKDVTDSLKLELGQEKLSIIFEESEKQMNEDVITPLFSNVLYQNTAYYEKMVSEDLPGVPVIAFHSYKGGVGRTLSMLAFAKAWSQEASNEKILIIDSDIEAPGLSWLWNSESEITFSYLDLLEVIQSHVEVQEIVELVVDRINKMTMKIATEKMEVEQFFLPTYRYLEQLLDIYSSPESIVKGYKRKYIIAEVLSEIGKRLGASVVLIDLRAGISEFSAPILFDPRVKKYIVTSTSYQSIKGTELLLQQLAKGLPVTEDARIPEVLLTMVINSEHTVDIVSRLASIYEQTETDNSLMDNLVTELPFASELVHLESLNQILKNLEGRDFYKNICSIVISNYLEKVENAIAIFDRNEIIYNIHNLSKNQINAEGNIDFNILLTTPISNLVRRFESDVPIAVVIGAKGSGKTFLYREMLRYQYWERFSGNLLKREKLEEDTLVVPLLAARNSGNMENLFKACFDNYNSLLDRNEADASFYMDNEKAIRQFLKQEHDLLDWGAFWKQLFLPDHFESLLQMNDVLKAKGKKVLFIIDGLEELLTETMNSVNEKRAVSALCQDVLNEFRVKYKNIGCIVFLRKDLARNSIEENFEQFNTVYKAYELNWSKTEALRLVLWLVNQAVPSFYDETVPIESALPDVIENNLIKLWGNKLGKSTSNEAYSSRWILAALSDFNGQLQARDMIRFLQNATEEVGKKIYDDRYIMPAEIKKALPKCSLMKIAEIKEEVKELKPILEKFENSSSDKKNLPFYRDTFELSAKEEQLLKQEGYLRIDNEKYYLPEIIRHALKFKYERGARPKVLSLLLNK